MDQLLGESDDAGSVGALGGEELVLACDVLCCGFASRTVPESILPFISEAALQEVLGLPLREQLRRFLQLLPVGLYTCYDRVKRMRLQRLRCCCRLPLADYTETECLGEAVPAGKFFTCICRRCFSSGALRAQVIDSESSVSYSTSGGNEESCGERLVLGV